jgi:hypothetical protein
VTELTPEVGVGLCQALGGSFEVSAVLTAGVTLQRFTVHLPGAVVPSGTNWEPLTQLPVSLSWKLGQTVVLGIEVTPGLTFHSYDHTWGSQVLWQRGLLRLAGGAWIGMEF